MKPQENHIASTLSNNYVAAWKFQSMFSHSIVLYNQEIISIFLAIKVELVY